MNNPVIIVGAGLAGLRAATLLQAEGIDYRILEARNRVGGRILTNVSSYVPESGKFDLGPTWFWPRYEKSISKLVQELQLETFAQYTQGAMLFERYEGRSPERHVLPENAIERSLRFTDGAQALINALVDQLPLDKIELGVHVKAMDLSRESISIRAEDVEGNTKEYTANHVIFALPPRLIAKHIHFSPVLSEQTLRDLMNKPTWMASQAKAVAVYDRPFWRETGHSGMASSWIGPLQEIHDASPETGTGALFGFFGMPAKTRQELGETQISKLVIDQLVRLFGPEAREVQTILLQDWSTEPDTTVQDDLTPLQSYPDYGEISIDGNWKHKIIFAGTETSLNYGGHLEGALLSAERAVNMIIKFVK
ncbi:MULTISPECIES: flavin monoamine oxidase family protein [Paenibacillus]|uniref:flavin monoamine oxidase family protein n=1 Tax=Paenibacillus TaxID=44249 RepID=UPI0004184142|nr:MULTISPECIES: FAD-dependent oxidoreductase [Paenibacillus]KGP77716.1 amine oxidase [Paenibacillus sp. MAEPY2]KGP77970.1 amine oxidase [Paenibacillus sp. MAEPY1]OZQ62835.1 amine oxidase [Paenibacillus taichungensis]SFT00241.1 monoamine oxidase [Paenibacillus sp. 453mf]